MPDSTKMARDIFTGRSTDSNLAYTFVDMARGHC
jgi:hypothetical protein